MPYAIGWILYIGFIIYMLVTLLSCTKDPNALEPRTSIEPPPAADSCLRVQMYIDSLHGGQVVSHYLGYDEVVCGQDLKGFTAGAFYWCDSFHMRTIIFLPIQNTNDAND